MASKKKGDFQVLLNIRPEKIKDVEYDLNEKCMYLKKNETVFYGKFHKVFKGTKQAKLFDLIIKPLLVKVHLFMLIFAYGVTEAGKVRLSYYSPFCYRFFLSRFLIVTNLFLIVP